MLCVFDLDGTLVDTRAVYYKALEDYAISKGLKLPNYSDRDKVFGNPNPPLFFEGWADNLADFDRHLSNIYDITDQMIC